MKLIITTALAISLLSGLVSIAHADGRGRQHHERRDWHERHDDRRDHGRYNNHRHDHGRYYHVQAPHHRWRNGDRLPVIYHSSRYYVRDYRSYRLRTPPRGHRWVRVNNDVLLTAIATGVVIHVVHDLFH